MLLAVFVYLFTEAFKTNSLRLTSFLPLSLKRCKMYLLVEFFPLIDSKVEFGKNKRLVY